MYKTTAAALHGANSMPPRQQQQQQHAAVSWFNASVRRSQLCIATITEETSKVSGKCRWLAAGCLGGCLGSAGRWAVGMMGWCVRACVSVPPNQKKRLRQGTGPRVECVALELGPGASESLCRILTGSG
jgi:hypothetical protein